MIAKLLFDKKPFHDVSVNLNQRGLDAYPGFYPYTGGPYASIKHRSTMDYTTICGFFTAEASNRFYKDNLGRAKGLSVAF